MDAAEAFRQGLGSVSRARQAKSPLAREGSHESDGQSPKIAHTLAACCRCRQRKTRCDPTLPKCIPCERAGATCDYYDASKKIRISRTYVIRLQDKVRELEAELSHYTDDEPSLPKPEDAIRPGGFVRLDQNDETPRFLGPSSGIAMARLVMEEAKKYTDSRSIRELVPEVCQRRTPTKSPDSRAERKRSYPMISAYAAEKFPSRHITDQLVEVFNQTAQYLLPTLHEPTFAREVDEVYAGSTDPYKNFVLRMVLAISMHRLDSQYAGLADSYYLAAMADIEAVIRPKDLKTLQCLVLVAQYSLLTPTRTAIYYIVGMATRLCQQLGLTEEKTIVRGLSLGSMDTLQIDMKRRLLWIVLSMELGLAHSLGRPNGFATGQDHIDVGFFEMVDDEYITSNGVIHGPLSEKKAVAIHFFKMRLLQAEIRRILYQCKRPEPKNDEDPWYAEMEQKLQAWLDASPSSPNWSKPWFTLKYNTIIVFLHRPSPQVPKPSARAALMCYDASVKNIRMQENHMDSGSVDITWVFIQSLYMAVNTMLWSISFQEVRNLHTKEEIEEHLQIALELINRCSERWPGATSASQLYLKLGAACLKSYNATEGSLSFSANSPASLTDAASPQSEHSSGSLTYSQKAPDAPPSFGYVFDQPPDQSVATEYHNSVLAVQQPAFRSGSIFISPASSRAYRRFSYFPPELTQKLQNPNEMGSTAISDANSQLSVQTSFPMPDLNIFNEPSYFMQPQYNFGPQMFSEQIFDRSERQGSLSHQQQQELMDSLETDGISGINNFLNPTSQLFGPTKV